MTVSTLDAHINAAIRLQQEVDTAYIAIGKSSPWADDTNPPQEDIDTSQLQEVIGYKKVNKFSLARPLKDGESVTDVTYPTVTYSGVTWVLIPVSEAYSEKARHLYIEATIDPADLPSGEYRQVGLHIGLQSSQGVSKTSLLPSEVGDTGTLHFFANREPLNRTSERKVTEQFVIIV